MGYKFQTYSPLERRYSDTQAILAIANQTPESNSAYTELFQHHYDPLLSYAINIIKDRQEAEDIVSTVLGEKFYNNRDKLAATATTGDLNLNAWFHRVTKHLCLNVMRDRRRRDNKLIDAKRQDYTGFYAVLFAYSGSNIIDHLYTRETQKRIEDAVQNLSPDHQQILQLRYEKDMSYREIADTLRIKIGTVMSRLCRARSRLQELAPDLEELLAA